MLPTTPTRTDSRANNRVVDSVPARGRVCAHFFFFSKCFAWNLALIPGWSTARRAQGMSYDHTTVIIPHPIRTAKSSTVGPNQYCGGGPRGNLGCRRASFYFLFYFFSKCFALKFGPYSRVEHRSARAGYVLRSHHSDYTASHPNCEVKHCWAQSVLRWGTTRESWVS